VATTLNNLAILDKNQKPVPKRMSEPTDIAARTQHFNEAVRAFRPPPFICATSVTT
jgi:hypothetical protein